MESQGPEAVVEHLRELADRQDLIERALQGMVLFWQAADAEEVDWAFTLKELRPELGAQMLCFSSGRGNVDAPYIATNLQLYVFDYHVGWYERLTTIDGEVIREDAAIKDDFYSDGRAATLVERARGRAEGDRREWIGLVGLRSTPGNDFFPEWALGGFTMIVALATDEEEYRERVETFFTGLGGEVEELEDIEPFAEWLRANPGADDEFVELAAGLSDSSPVLHASAIHSYRSDDEDDEDEDGE